MLRAFEPKLRGAGVLLAELDWAELLDKSKVLWSAVRLGTLRQDDVEHLLHLCGRAAATQSILLYVEAQTYRYFDGTNNVIHTGEDAWENVATYYQALFGRYLQKLGSPRPGYMNAATEYLENAGGAFPPFVEFDDV